MKTMTRSICGALLIGTLLASCVQVTPAAPLLPSATAVPVHPSATANETLPTPEKSVTQPPIAPAVVTEVIQAEPVLLDTPTGSQQILVQQAQQDLAQRLSIPTDKIKLVTIYSTTFADASLGCPEPGIAYAQVTMEGVVIQLEANDRTYEYHQSGNNAPFLCKKPLGSGGNKP